MYAPIALFTYCRPEHTRKTVEALLLNPQSAESDLIVFSDGPKTILQKQAVDEVRQYIDSIRGFKTVKIICRDKNYGLAKSIIDGVSQVLLEYKSIIVLEDDIVTSPYFLQFMNQGLDKYEQNSNVASIHGYVYPVKERLPETFFMKGADCWGWATWERAWSKFNPDGSVLLAELQEKKLIFDFDLNGAFAYSEMLKEQVQGKNQSWAIRWHASAFLANMYTLYPGRSLVKNIGHDNTGTHSGLTEEFNAEVSASPIMLRNILIEESQSAHSAFQRYFRDKNNEEDSIFKIGMKIFKSILGNLLPPFITKGIRYLMRRKLNQSQESNSLPSIWFEGDFASWKDASDLCKGYDQQNILSTVLDAAIKVASGEAVYERDSVIFDKVEYAWPVLAALMWSAARHNGELIVLDYGGALGSSYFQNRRFLGDLPLVSWNVVEQSHYAVVGRENIKNDFLNFYDSIDACLTNIKPNIILLSSVIQYLPNPLETIKKLIKIYPDTFVIDRTSFIKEGNTTRLKIQHVPATIYDATYPCWFLSEEILIDCFTAERYMLVETFDSLDKLDSSACWKGMIFKRVDYE